MIEAQDNGTVQVVLLTQFLGDFWSKNERKELVKLNHPFNLFAKRKEIKFNALLTLDDGKFGSEFEADNRVTNVEFNDGFIELRNPFLNRGNNLNKVLVEDPNPGSRAVYFLGDRRNIVIFDLKTMTERCIDVPQEITKPVQLFFLDSLYLLTEDGTVVMFAKDLGGYYWIHEPDRESGCLYRSMTVRQVTPKIMVLSAATEYRVNCDSVKLLTKVLQFESNYRVKCIKEFVEIVPPSEMLLGSPHHHFIASFSSGNFIAASMNRNKILIIDIHKGGCKSKSQALDLAPQERILCVKAEELMCWILTSKGRCLIYSF
jgi:hypothetical protein